ncbi:hypothetical protein KXD40_005281 [Peronospora effusa]|nr:hypothetical protein KXD40_005281 [Peronospora effusa]
MSQEKPISGFRDRLAALRSKAYRVQALALSARWCVQLMDSDILKGFVGCTTFSAMYEVLCVQLMDSDILKGFVGCTTFSAMYEVLCARFKKTFWN